MGIVYIGKGEKSLKRNEFSLIDVFFIGMITASLNRIIFVPAVAFIQSNIGYVVEHLVLTVVISVVYYVIKKFRRSK